MCFQEDVMEVAKDFAGLSMGEADVLRKGVGKKAPEFIAKQRPMFYEGGQQPRIRVTFDQPVLFNGEMTKVIVTKPRNPDLKAAVRDTQYTEIQSDGSLGAAIMRRTSVGFTDRLV
jgi:hypothetical protein